MFKNFKKKLGFFENCSRMDPFGYGDDNYSNSGEALRDHDCLPIQKHEESINMRTTKPKQKNDLKIIGLWILGIAIFLVVFLIVLYLSKSFN